MKSLKSLTNKQLYKIYIDNCLCEYDDNGKLSEEGKKSLKRYNSIEREIIRRYFKAVKIFLKEVKDLPIDTIDRYKEVDFNQTLRYVE